MIRLMHSKINIGLFAFALCLFCTLPTNAQVQNEEERVFIQIEIKGLACPYCAFGMEKELKKVSGVENVDIKLKTGMAYISTPIAQKPTKESLSKIITDAGFTAGNIVFSTKSFVQKKEKKE